MKAGDESAAHASVIAREAEARGGDLLKEMKLQSTHRTPGPGRGKKTVGAKGQTVSPLKSLGLTASDAKVFHGARQMDGQFRGLSPGRGTRGLT